MFPRLIEVNGKTLVLQMIQEGKEEETASYKQAISCVEGSHSIDDGSPEQQLNHQLTLTTTRNTYLGLDWHPGSVSFKVVGHNLFVFLNRKGHLTDPDAEECDDEEEKHTAFLVRVDLTTFEKTVLKTLHLT